MSSQVGPRFGKLAWIQLTMEKNGPRNLSAVGIVQGLSICQWMTANLGSQICSPLDSPEPRHLRVPDQGYSLVSAPSPWLSGHRMECLCSSSRFAVH